MKETLKINSDNMKLIESLVMFADSDVMFLSKINDYLYHLGHSIKDFKTKQEYHDKLHDALIMLSDVVK